MNATKTLKATFVAIAALAGTLSAEATTTSNQFTVSVSLTSMCEQTNNSTQTLNFGTYTAFQTSALSATSPVSLQFRCTRGFAPTSVAFDGNTPIGVIQGLQYTLSAAAAVTANGIVATTATIGTGDTVSYSVSGSMPADQAGTCATASCGPTTQTRTLIVTF